MKKSFSSAMITAAKNNRKKLSDEEYNDWLCRLSDEFAAIFY